MSKVHPAMRQHIIKEVVGILLPMNKSNINKPITDKSADNLRKNLLLKKLFITRSDFCRQI